MKTADCGVFFTAQSPEPPILASQSHGQLVASCDCVAKPLRTRYHHRELCATMGDFDDDGVERNSAREGEGGRGRMRVVTYGFFGVLYFDNYLF